MIEVSVKPHPGRTSQRSQGSKWVMECLKLLSKVARGKSVVGMLNKNLGFRCTEIACDAI